MFYHAFQCNNIHKIKFPYASLVLKGNLISYSFLCKPSWTLIIIIVLWAFSVWYAKAKAGNKHSADDNERH